MKESRFIDIRKESWRGIENYLKGSKEISNDQISQDFIQLSDDLSYAQTQFPGSAVVEYLNVLMSLLHKKLYRNKHANLQRIYKFFKQDLPLSVRAGHRMILLSLIIFITSISIGVISTSVYENYPSYILSEGYIEFTKNAIQDGDPMAIYKQGNRDNSFFFYLYNNTQVMLLSFVLGLVFSVGTVYILLVNGIMLGAFHLLFFKYGGVETSFLTIYIHGAIEISAIIIAGGAGLLMGNSILFPQSFSRMDSLRRGARLGVNIVVGCVPLIFFAAFMEAYITGSYQSIPLFLNVLIIGVPFLSLIIYLFVYPYFIPIKKSEIPKFLDIE